MIKFSIFCSALFCLSIQADEINLFNGSNLDDWEGDKRYWSLEDGTITGRSTAENPLSKTTYLIYKKQEFANFELTLSYRFLSAKGNSGIQYRSSRVGKEGYRIKGYQADMEVGKKFSGIFYEQDGRGIVAKRGQQLKIDQKGKKTIEPNLIKEAENAQQSLDTAEKGKWHSYRIVADGRVLTHEINGFKTIEVEDNDANRSAVKGLLALQLHQGPPMTVQFKDINILELPDTPKVKKAVDEVKLEAMKGFEVEKIYSVNKKEEGSWVAMCFDDKGALFVGDQYGYVYKLTLKDGEVVAKKKIENVKQVQGLCWAFGSLYVSSQNKKKSGLHRLTDTNGDGEFDKTEHILFARGGGEHGPHSVIVAPDGKGLHYILGNFSAPLENAKSISNRNWRRDTLHPHLPDGIGHAAHVRVPAGILLYVSPDGKETEIIASGMRNTFDIAKSPTGEVFGYDADMEYDIGAPWYRPTRVMHFVKGAEYGWRTGTAKWPTYYPDSLSSVIDVGPGSPSGMVFGTGAKFPEKYQKAVFINDWTFGRMYAVHLAPDGVSYQATKETFISGKPLPLTDVSIGPDGNMYFLTGGRRLGSGLYRVKYVGNESTELADVPKVTEAEKKLDRIAISRDVDELWKEMGSADRTLRFAARVSLETLDLEDWSARFASETDPQTLINASIAFSRRAGDSVMNYGQLLTLDFAQMNEGLQLQYLRAVGLAGIRTAAISGEQRLQMLEKLHAHYPSTSAVLNRELCRLLVYLESPEVLGKTIFLLNSSIAVRNDISDELLDGNDNYSKDFRNMQANQPDSQGLHYALMLKNQKNGWDAQSVADYYGWIAGAKTKSGGRSYILFLENIAKEAMTHLSPELKQQAEAELKVVPKKEKIVLAKGPGRNWTMAGAIKATQELSNANRENGKRMFQAVLCARCHTHSGVGGSAGPDLTNLASRFSKKDIITAIIDPSEVISEQYEATVFTLKNQSTVQGRLIKDDGDELQIATNVFDASEIKKIKKSSVVKTEVSKVSTMPPSLINALSANELRDLMLYLTTQPE